MSYPQDIPDWEPVVGDDPYNYSLAEAAGQSGEGIIGYYGGHSYHVKPAYEFMISQYKRFGEPVPDMDMIEFAWDQAFYAIDVFDPYLLLEGCCDVIKTEDSYYYQYSLSEDGVTWREVPANEVETFSYWQEGEKQWDKIQRSPGLKEHFDHVYDYFKDNFDFIRDDSHPECYNEEWALINRYGGNTEHLAHVGIWAAIIWMCSPFKEAKAWRYEYHPIFKNCYDYGNSVLHGWVFYDQDYFRRLPRKAQTCSGCGADQWCVDYTQTSHTESAYTCEHCLSGGQPFPGRICGTRLCESTSCQHHPVSLAKTPAQKKQVKLAMKQIAADKRFGPLRQLENNQKVRELPGFIKINQIAIEYYSNSITDAVGDVFKELIGPK